MRFAWTGSAVGCALALVAALAPSAAPAGPPPLPRVVLIGIDGGSWNLIDRAWRKGELPSLRAVAERGAQAVLASVEPTNSPTVWTSIATGRSPTAHGVTHFYATRHAVEAPVVFEMLARRGRRVGLYDYLVTWPPPELPGGFVIPGWMRRSERVTPADVFTRIERTPYAYSSEALRTPEEVLANCQREAAEKPERFVRLWRAFDLELGAVTFYGLDAASHRFWHAAFPGEFEGPLPAATPAHAAAIEDTLRGIDRGVGTIVAALGPEDVVVVVSDHGFAADPRGVRRKWVTHFAEPLTRAGLAKRGIRVVTGWRRLVIDVGPGEAVEREATLARLVALLEGAETAGGEPLFDVAVTRRAPPPGWLGAAQAALQAWLDDGKNPLVSPEGFAAVYADVQPEVASAAWPNGTVRVGGRVLRARELLHAVDFSGDHTPDGILLAAGGPIRPSAARGRLSVLDVAPLLLALLGEPAPAALEGRVPVSLLTQDFQRAHPPRRVAQDATLSPAAALRAGAERPAFASTDDTELREQLRSLGYAE
jgi:arylsulfatase A-like enzyme